MVVDNSEILVLLLDELFKLLVLFELLKCFVDIVPVAVKVESGLCLEVSFGFWIAIPEYF